jgi:hypothetical protein
MILYDGLFESCQGDFVTSFRDQIPDQFGNDKRHLPPMARELTEGNFVAIFIPPYYILSLCLRKEAMVGM